MKATFSALRARLEGVLPKGWERGPPSPRVSDRVKSGGDGENNSDSLMGQFGLGDATGIDRVRVEWPSGVVQELTNTAANQILIVTEPPRLVSRQRPNAAGFQLNLTGAAGLTYGLEVSTDLTNWTAIATLTNSSRTTAYTDPDALNCGQRFYRATQLGLSPGATP